MTIELGRDIVISDDEIDNTNKILDEYKEFYNKRLESYLKILKNILEEGIPEGNVHENLNLFINQLSILKEINNKIIFMSVENNKNIIEDFNDADDCLF